MQSRQSDSYPAFEEIARNGTLEEMYSFLEWALEQNPLQPKNSYFKCNSGESYLTAHSIFPWAIDPKSHFVQGDDCQELSNVVQACPKSGHYKHYELDPEVMTLINAKCPAGSFFDSLFPHREKHPRAVTFKECLEFTGKWRIISLERFIDHMERHGGPAYGGCLGHMVFDMIASKAINPLIPLPSLASSAGRRSGKGTW
jgi:hypothetical protein